MKRFGYPLVSSVGAAMLLEDSSSAEPVFSSGYTIKPQNYRLTMKLWDKVIIFASSSEVYRLEWTCLRHTQWNTTKWRVKNCRNIKKKTKSSRRNSKFASLLLDFLFFIIAYSSHRLTANLHFRLQEHRMSLKYCCYAFVSWHALKPLAIRWSFSASACVNSKESKSP